MEPLLRLDKLCKDFSTIEGQTIQAIEDISLSIEEGEFVSIVGPSGCGKTTLLRTIAGLEKPTKGAIVFRANGTELNQRQNIGLVFQEFVLLPWRSVLANIALGLEIRGLNKQERRSKALEYVRIVELEGFENKYPKELSGGMKQRVAIARAMICNPTILLMDEPFAALDAQTRFNMQEFLLRIWNKTNKTILFVTHNVDEAVFLSQRAITLSERPGRITSDIPIDVPYPRDIHGPDFMQVRRQLLNCT